MSNKHSKKSFWNSLFKKKRRASDQAIIQLQGILETTVDAIVTANEQGIIFTFNKAAENMFGYSKEEAIGQNISILMPAPYDKEHDQYVKNYLKTGAKKIIGSGRELTAKKRDGTVFPIYIGVSEGKIGRQSLFTAIIRDLTAQKDAEKAKQAKLKVEAEIAAKNQFLAMMSHDLRTPMHAIMGYTEYLMKELDGPLNEEQKANLQHIYDASVYLMGMISSILELSKHALQQSLSMEEIDVLAIIKSCIAAILPKAKEKGLTIKEQFRCKACFLQADKEKMQRIFMNLLSNAVKFTDKGTIFVESHCDLTHMFIMIKDTGIGIDETDLQRLFTPFVRLDPSHKEGTGLGLTITKRLIELHGGTITVTSKKGEGTTFSITLPTNVKMIDPKY